MPLPTNLNVFLGASVLGIVCAATMYVVEHYRQEKRRHGMVREMARLDYEISEVRRELEKILAQQKKQGAKGRNKNRRNGGGKAASIVSTSTTDDYTSAVDDSSDLEFYDVSDEEEADGDTLAASLKEIDELLEGDSESEFETALSRLQLLSVDHPNNAHLMWRIAKAYYNLAMKKTDDKALMREHIDKGVEICAAALDGPAPLAEVHKWMAVLVGSRSELQSTKDRILDATVFKRHVDAGLELNPTDPVLHHMLGRFCFEMASLKWYERKVAGALFAELPTATVEQALDHFLECDRLQQKPWKNNLYFIGKCKIALGDVDEGVTHLVKAKEAATDNGVDDDIDVELKALLEQYSTAS